MSKNAEILKRLRAAAVERGLCYVCRCRFPRPGVRSCDDCIARAKRHEETTPKGIAMRKRHMAASNARRTAKLKAAGLCVQCGRRPAVADRTRCSVCLDSLANRIRTIARSKGVMPDGRRCSICGQTGHFAPRHRRPGVLP